MPQQLTYTPDYAVAPGATLREILESKNMPQAEFAARMEMAEKTVSQIINGTAPITYETACKLELVLGIPARFWNAREAQYRDALHRARKAGQFQAEKEWLKSLPVSQIIEYKCTKMPEDTALLVRQCLEYFEVCSIHAWNAVWLQQQIQFRGAKARKRRPGFVAAWQRMGEIAAEQIACKPFDASAFRKALREIRSLAVWKSRVQDLCAEAGVAVVLIPEIPLAGVSGITKWISKDKALIVLSRKNKTDEHVWFRFYHAAGHVLKHAKKSIFYEEGIREDDPLELEANKFAQDFLIASQHAQKLPLLRGRAAI
jgi:HTH-type transcriptional regulator/antitoxin HigA